MILHAVLLIWEQKRLTYLLFADVFLTARVVQNLLTLIEVSTIGYAKLHSAQNFFEACALSHTVKYLDKKLDVRSKAVY